MTAEPSATGAAVACRALLTPGGALGKRLAPAPGRATPTAPGPCTDLRGMSPSAPAHSPVSQLPPLARFALANPTLEPSSGSPVSEQTPFGRSLALREPPALTQKTAPAAASRLPAIKKRRRMPLCSEPPDTEPALVGEAGQAGGRAACQSLTLNPKTPAAGPWDADLALGSEARQAGGRTPRQTLTPDPHIPAAGLCDAVEDAALRQTGLWSPSSPIAGYTPGAANEGETSFSIGACDTWKVHAAAHATRRSPRTAPAGPLEREVPLLAPAPTLRNSNPGPAARRAADAAGLGGEGIACWGLDTLTAHARGASGLGAANGVLPASAAADPNSVPISNQVPGASTAGVSQTRPAKRRIKLPCLPLLVGLADAPQRAASATIPAGFPGSSTAAACGAQSTKGALDKEARESRTTPQYGGSMLPPQAPVSLAVSAAEAAEPARGICGGAAGDAMHPEEEACAGRAGVGRACASLPPPVLEQALATRSHGDDWASVFSFL